MATKVAPQSTPDGGEAIVEAFRNLGVDYILSSPGTEWAPVWEAMANQQKEGRNGPRLLDFWHETLAVNVAGEIPVDGSGSVVEIGQLPARGDNWVGPETLEVAAGALVGGTTTFEEPRWPWSHLAKLVSSLVLALFALGMYVTRRPRSRPARVK